MPTYGLYSKHWAEWRGSNFYRTANGDAKVEVTEVFEAPSLEEARKWRGAEGFVGEVGDYVGRATEGQVRFRTVSARGPYGYKSEILDFSEEHFSGLLRELKDDLERKRERKESAKRRAVVESIALSAMGIKGARLPLRASRGQ